MIINKYNVVFNDDNSVNVTMVDGSEVDRSNPEYVSLFRTVEEKTFLTYIYVYNGSAEIPGRLDIEEDSEERMYKILDYCNEQGEDPVSKVLAFVPATLENVEKWREYKRKNPGTTTIFKDRIGRWTTDLKEVVIDYFLVSEDEGMMEDLEDYE